MQSMLFIFNPLAGTTSVKFRIGEIINIFTAGGYDVLAHPTQSADDMEDIIKERGEEFDTIVICGGDGSLNDAINGLMTLNNPPTLGYIPTGTMNDFAVSHNLSQKVDQAARDIVSGNVTYTDIGCFNGRYFSYVAAFGILTDVSYDTPQSSKNVFGKTAYIFEGIRRLPSYTSNHLRVESADMVLEGDYSYGMVCNAMSVGGFNLDRMTDGGISMDDGMMELILIKKGALELFNTAVMLNTLITGLKNNNDIEYLRIKNAKITSSEPISWTLDGEFGGNIREANISCIPRKLKLYIPGRIHRSNSQYMKMNRHIDDK